MAASVLETAATISANCCLCRARTALWGIRTKPVEELLAQFWEHQLACTEGKQELPRPYVLLRTGTLIGDSIGGIGNRLPGVVTGDARSMHCLLVYVRGCMGISLPSRISTWSLPSSRGLCEACLRKGREGVREDEKGKGRKGTEGKTITCSAKSQLATVLKVHAC